MSILPLSPVLLGGLSNDEAELIEALTDQLGRVAGPNMEANAYYEARHVLSSPGFTIPQEVASRLAPVVGAPGTVVDVLDERLDFLGWDDAGADDLGLGEVYDANELDAEAPMVHLDALIFGTAFARVGTGAGTPLVTMHPPTTTTGLRDPATRRLRAAWTSLEVRDGETVRGVLDVPDEAVTVERRQGRWVVVDRDQHRMGRVPVVQFSNRPRASRRGGRSEITPAIRSLTEDMMRAALGMNVNTMFYSIPQLMVLGRGPDAFKDRNGNPVPGWKILAGHALAINKDADGDIPEIHQLQVASPQPFIEQLRDFRMQVASEAGMPADYLGIQTSNPSSADAIRMGESRLVKRTERRQSGFGRSWLEVARLSLLVRDGGVPEDFASRIAVDWQNAATPTRAAAADEVTKLVGVGVLEPGSEVVRKRLSLTRSETRLLDAEQARARARRSVDELIAAAGNRTAVTGGDGD
ncbi:phage portal protein [Georgenia thermotolerans]|uniref:phage portal protein n=1 Tax=Georgenia thermotolerans TaxID=527326 RepID=UPI001264C514|nr:phage portal protein [Georgenia thermotolerans]